LRLPDQVNLSNVVICRNLVRHLEIMILSSILCFAASVAALTLEIASSGGNQSSPLLYGLLYEVSPRFSFVPIFANLKLKLTFHRISTTRVMVASMVRCSGTEHSKDPRLVELPV
jgi:hypothetical protein